MIKYDSGEIIDLLPLNLIDDEVIAISYALKMAMAKMNEWRNNIMLYANIDNLPDEILDYLSVELQSQYYSVDLPIDKKRALIKNTLAWYQKAGTVSAVEEMIDIIFGSGEVVEWQDFAGGPGTPGVFDIITEIAATPDAIKQLNLVIQNVKNASSTLRGLTIKRYLQLILQAYLEKHSVTLQTDIKEDMQLLKELLKIAFDIDSTGSFEAFLNRDERWYLDGEYLLNGDRVFNSEIVRIEL